MYRSSSCSILLEAGFSDESTTATDLSQIGCRPDRRHDPDERLAMEPTGGFSQDPHAVHDYAGPGVGMEPLQEPWRPYLCRWSGLETIHRLPDFQDARV